MKTRNGIIISVKLRTTVGPVWCHPEQLCLWSWRAFASPQSPHSSSQLGKLLIHKQVKFLVESQSQLHNSCFLTLTNRKPFICYIDGHHCSWHSVTFRVIWTLTLIKSVIIDECWCDRTCPFTALIIITLRSSCGAVYCNRSCLFVCGCVCGSVTTITRNCVYRSSPNSVCR